MKSIEIDEDLYQYIASNTQFIGESASSILRRLLVLEEISVKERVGKEDKVTTVSESSSIKTSASTEIATDKKTRQTQDSVFNYINKEELAMQRGAVGRFLLILAALYRVHPNQFAVVCEIRGRDRLYFTASESELADSGSSTNPYQIKGSPFWVITNTNTTRKKMMLTKAAIALGYTDEEAEKIRDLL